MDDHEVRPRGTGCFDGNLPPYQSALARILTPPQHIVKNFCRLHRLSYYIVMLRYFFRILFSSLLCYYRLCRWHCSWSTFSIYSAFGLVTHHTLFQFSYYHRYRLYSTLILSNLILYCTEAVVVG